MVGRERETVLSFLFHASYSGLAKIPPDAVDAVVNSITKPGFLRSMFGAFAANVMGADAAFFNSTLRQNPLPMPFLALAGEASLASLLTPVWGPVGKNVTLDVVPQAGHFVADENPEWVAQRLTDFFAPYAGEVPAVDLSVLKNRVTLI
jgi:pimeloyl-ACP methyl ester carboxylesterase